jgi:hypothetical protein
MGSQLRSKFEGDSRYFLIEVHLGNESEGIYKRK